MKNTNKMFLTVISTLAFFNASLSAMQSIPVFEIYNKDKDSIKLNISIFGQYGFEEDRDILSPDISSYKQWSPNPTAIDINDGLMIDILKQNKIVGKFVIMPNNGKTKYLTWNPAKAPYLYPQTGPWIGLKGKTESGLSLKNNVKYSEIEKR